FPAGYVLVIAVSGVKHNLLQSLYNTRREECAAATEALGVESLREVTPDHLEHAGGSVDPVLYQRAAHVVGENDRVWRAINALEKTDVAEVGALMFASHESSRTNFQNSTAELDLLVEIARSLPGVLGSRLTGGGFGGGTVTLATTEESENVVAGLKRKYANETGHDPAVFVCRIADGAAVRWRE
ncbi:MAG TPA: hypothetical protein VF551_04580, partial [Chthoniobacterales bacterium]